MNYWLSKPLIWLIPMLVCTALESYTPFDQAVQDFFYSQGEWLLTKAEHQRYKWFFYSGGKKFVSFAAVCFAVIMGCSFLLKNKTPKWKLWFMSSFLIVLCLIIIPALINILKGLTDVPCPYQLRAYGGQLEHIGFVETLFHNGYTNPSRGRCFPAAHASGGFALLSLYFLPANKMWRCIFFGFGMFCGWVMGIYQMIRGDHFITHTMVTMFLALFVVTLLAKIMKMEALLTENGVPCSAPKHIKYRVTSVKKSL
jgi:PAP2 (acid phosphatase) superfamily protein